MTPYVVRPPRLAQWLVRAAAGHDEAPYVAGDLDEEMQSVARRDGVSAARRWYWRQALASIGPLVRTRLAAPRVMPAEQLIEVFVRDAAFALRRLAGRPALAVVAATTLALGVGAATAIFTVVDGVLLRPLPFGDAKGLVTIWQTDTAYRHQPTLRSRWDRLWFTYPDFQRWSSEQRSLAAAALYGDGRMSLTGVGDPTEVAVFTATPSLLDVLASHVAFGRWFLPTEVGPNAARIAVLSHELWATRFGSDPSVIGRSIVLDEHAFRVVGVMPAGLRLSSLTNATRATAAIWIPLGSDGGGQRFDSSYEAIARLAPGYSAVAATAEIDQLVRAVSGRPERGARVLARLDAETGTARKPLALLSAGAVLLLLIACGNLATLLLGDAPARERELAIRRAVGASPSRVLRQLLTESAVLGSIGAVAGLAVSVVAVRMLIAMAPAGTPRIDDVSIDARALCWCAAVTVTAVLVFGLVPALSLGRSPGSESLRTRGGPGGRQRLQHGAVGLEIAMAMLLLWGATTLTTSLRKLSGVDSGLRPAGVLAIQLMIPQVRYRTPAAVLQYYDEVDARLRALPGVMSVGATSNPPFSDVNQTTSVQLDESTPPDARPNVQRRVVRAGYFATVGLPLIGGRLFSDGSGDSGDVMVVDESMARLLWPNASPIDRHVKALGRWFTVIGVVGAARHRRLDEPPRPTFYVSQSRFPTREMTMVVRLHGDPLARADEMRRAIWTLDASIPIPEVTTLENTLIRSMAWEVYRTTIVDLFGIVALLLTSVGVFGVALRAVNQRRRELGVRMALGASRSNIAREAVGTQIGSVAMGLILGLGGVCLAAPLLSDFTFDTKAADPRLIAFAGVVLLAVTGFAMIPSIRFAVRVDPVRVMREGD